MNTQDITKEQLETLVLVRSLEEFVTDEHENLSSLSEVIWTLEESLSDSVVIQKSKIMNHGTGALDWLKGYAATFCDEDLKIIKREIESLLTKLPEDILERDTF